ncbi:hypothetical protein HBO10_25025 [Pseudomonas sp. WS 5503]|uniref:hypothetical protein n=1 Tax=Pseudomonas TaxID=286 RepID=UPI001475AD87|nr:MULTISPECIES: hypothetical protein [Pseudomonas]NMX82795.1 hypothetical protein [Pseudomonas sp. WS 5503]NNB23661.1 hypothetical protein [Pseudomonas fragi]
MAFIFHPAKLDCSGVFFCGGREMSRHKFYSFCTDSNVQVYFCISALGSMLGIVVLMLLARTSGASISGVDVVTYMHFGLLSSLFTWFAYCEFWVGWRFPNNLLTDAAAVLLVAAAPLHLLFFPLIFK